MALALLVAFLVTAQDKPAETCALAGTVTDSATGVALSKAEIFLESLDNPHQPFVTANTDAKGKFSMTDVSPGSYRLKGVRNGYLDTYYGARRGDSEGITVALEAGQALGDVQLKLLPYAVIAGTVREADGEPVAGAKVWVRRLVYYNGRREFDTPDEIVTDDLGQYRAASLVPGKYYVEAQPKHAFEPMNPPTDHTAKTSPPREVLLPAYYPGVRDAAAAGAIEITAGARVTGIDIQLPRSRVYHISGHITAPPGVTGISIGPEDPSLFDRIAWVEAVNGDFDIRDVPPGAYLLKAGGSAPSSSWNAEIPIVVNGADVNAVTLSLTPSPEVSGQIVVESDKHIALDNCFVNFRDGRGARIRNDGSFSINLNPGHYVVEVIGAALRKDLAIRSIRMEQSDILRDGLTVNAGDKVRLEIVLAADGGQIEGPAVDKDDNPVAGATVVAVPELALRSQPNRFYTASTDQHGRYQLKNVAPGNYKIFAWGDIEPGAWFDPDFFRDIESHGEPVKLEAKAQHTVKAHLQEAK